MINTISYRLFLGANALRTGGEQQITYVKSSKTDLPDLT